MIRVVWHHKIFNTDAYQHSWGRPTDCWCEPEVDVLSGPQELVSHRVVRHQDMSLKDPKEALCTKTILK